MSGNRNQSLHFSLFVDCEATQQSIRDPDLGKRADTGIAELLEARHLRGTFHVLPGDAEANAPLYRDLKSRGHEIGLHVHPAEQGYGEFFGIYGPDEQHAILREARQRAEDALGFAVGSLCIGYGSTNDHSYRVFHEQGFRHGMTSIPTRILPECASVHAGAPLGMHYANPHNRVLPGNLDYVEVPVTVDPESRMWGGKHPQDLRIELVDAKNHFYTMKKSIDRQLAEKPPVIYLLAITHNVFDYSNPHDFRRLTLNGVLDHAQRLASQYQLQLTATTIGELAGLYRQAVPLSNSPVELKLDRRGYQRA